MLDMTDHLLSQHFDSIEADEARAERFDDAKEALTTENAIAIREALVKPGSNVGLLIVDDTDGFLECYDAMVRRLADPLPLLPEQKVRLLDELQRLVNAAIADAAVPSDRQVQMRVDEDARCPA